jgi:hypothetical protein
MANKLGNLTAAIRAPFAGNPNIPVPYPSVACSALNAPGIPFEWAYANQFEQRFANAAGTDYIHAMAVNSSNQLLIGDELARQARAHFTFSQYVTATIVSQIFATIPSACRVTQIQFICHVAGSVSGASKPTLYVEHLTSTQAPGSGVALSSTVDCHAATADTLQTLTLNMPTTGNTDDPNLYLAVGDRLGIVVAGTTTALAGVEVTVTVQPFKSQLVTFSIPLNADIPAAMAIFTANRPYILTAVSYSHTTKGSSGSAVTMQITNDPSGTAPGAGTALLTNNTNAGFDCRGIANTVQVGALTATAASLRLATGGALSFSITGTATALAGICITLTLQATSADRIEKTFSLFNVHGQTDLTGLSAQNIWTADRDYEILDIRERHAVVAGQAGTINAYVDSGTTAPGGGQAVATSAFDLTATANTAVAGTLQVLGLRFLLAGDRLSVKVASGSAASCQGEQITIALQPR